MNGNKSGEVPILSLPSNIRIENLNKKFCEEFKCKPTFFVRVPGRVNIIGEHIDYCGYPVLPMALEQDILVAGKCIDDHKIYLRNSSNKYTSVDFQIKSYEDINIESDSNGKPFWYSYVFCGVKGAMEYLNNKIVCGLQLYVDGNIPPASGLSSSSALVSSACLAFLYAQGAVLNKIEIASLCAKSERYIGTQGGGMDQAIAFLAEKHCAQYITWQPLKATAVALPENATFVVAHSLAEANKAATNDFNQRVIECRLAAKIIGLLLGATVDQKIVTLSQLQQKLGKNLQEMVELVLTYLPKDLYYKRDVCELLRVTEDELDNLYLTPNTIHINEFKLKQRALHVYEEAIRVEEFRNLCTKPMNGNLNSGQESTRKNDDLFIEKLGQLMSGSHDSLKNLYECSHKNLDSLVDISRKMGIHSRVTGAGWGGCTVALCPTGKADKYIETLKNEYYSKQCNIDKSTSGGYVFATSPNFGAIIYT